MRVLLVCVLAVGLAGCGDGRPVHAPAYPVSGKVTVNGQPAAGAMLVFHPAGEKQAAGPSPFAVVADDGTYRLTFYTPDEGAPEGAYTVTVVWMVKGKEREGKITIGEGGGGGTDKLGGRYADVRSSKLSATVQRGLSNTIDFDLK